MNAQEPLGTKGVQEGVHTQIFSPRKVRRKTKRFIRKLAPGLQRASKGVDHAAKMVHRRLTQTTGPSSGRYDHSCKIPVNRANVFFALMDSRKYLRQGAARDDYRTYAPSRRALSRARRRRQRGSFQWEAPQTRRV